MLRRTRYQVNCVRGFIMPRNSDIMLRQMRSVSTREAARKLGISLISLQRYIAARKITVPKIQNFHGVRIRLWTARDIKRVRKELPGIKNGRSKKGKS